MKKKRNSISKIACYHWTQGILPKVISIAKMLVMCCINLNSARKRGSYKWTHHESRYVQVGILEKQLK